MTRILVTGAAGFIGSHLSERLLERGDQVLGLDNFDDYYDPAIKRSNLEAAIAHPGFELAEVDLRDRTQLASLLTQWRPDKVMHLAAMAGVRPSIERPQVYQEVNVGGTLNLLDAMLAAGVSRLVLGSTSSVYGAASKPPFRETDPVDQPMSPYAATKRAAELLCYTYHHLHDLRVTTLRFFTVYGPRQRPEMAIHRFCRLLMAGEKIPMFGDGSSVRDYTFVLDILDGVVKALDADQDWGVYNLGENRMVALGDLISMLAEALGVEAKIERLDNQPGDVPATCADISAAQRDLGYAPSFPIERGIQEFVRWVQEGES